MLTTVAVDARVRDDSMAAPDARFSKVDDGGTFYEDMPTRV